MMKTNQIKEIRLGPNLRANCRLILVCTDGKCPTLQQLVKFATKIKKPKNYSDLLLLSSERLWLLLEVKACLMFGYNLQGTFIKKTKNKSLLSLHCTTDNINKESDDHDK